VPTVIVSVLAAYAWIVLNDVEAKKTDEMHVRVVAQQFAWKFEYTDAQQGKVVSDILYLPVDKPVKFDVVTLDVLHSFWVPNFRLKTDTVPGLTTHVRVTPNEIGNFSVVCTELCGLGHATMRQDVHVVSSQDFEEWLSKQKPVKDGDQAPAGGATPGESASARPTIPAPAG
jgi:cytochrome c oxidase subunit 2